MKDHLKTIENERKFSRRGLIGGFIGSVAIGAAVAQLEKGIMLTPPPLEIKDATISRTIEGVELYSISTLEEDGNESILTVSKGRLLYEPTGQFFGYPMLYVHRGGNGRVTASEVLRKADQEGREGPLILDVDANLVNGVVHAEHGIVYKSGLPLLRRLPPFIVDIHEGELRLGNLETYEEVVAHAAKLSGDYTRKIALSIELKRVDDGTEFSVPVLHEMCAINQRYKVPAIMHSPNPNQFDAISREVASSTT